MDTEPKIKDQINSPTKDKKNAKNHNLNSPERRPPDPFKTAHNHIHNQANLRIYDSNTKGDPEEKNPRSWQTSMYIDRHVSV